MIRCSLEFDTRGFFSRGEEMEVAEASITAIQRQDDGTVLLTTKDGMVVRTSMRLALVRENIAKAAT